MSSKHGGTFHLVLALSVGLVMVVAIGVFVWLLLRRAIRPVDAAIAIGFLLILATVALAPVLAVQRLIRMPTPTRIDRTPFASFQAVVFSKAPSLISEGRTYRGYLSIEPDGLRFGPRGQNSEITPWREVLEVEVGKIGKPLNRTVVLRWRDHIELRQARLWTSEGIAVSPEQLASIAADLVNHGASPATQLS